MVIAFLNLKFGSPEPLILGFYFGTLFSHTTMVASWLAFAPKGMWQRISLACAWVLALGAALACNMRLYGGPENIVAFAAICAITQFVLLQPALFGMVVGFGFQLRHVDDQEGFSQPTRQFSIGHLMTIMTVVGVALGVGRMAAWLWADQFPGSAELPFFLCYLLVAVVLTLPLLVIVLLPRLPLSRLVILPILFAITMATEPPIMRILEGGPGPPLMDFLSINIGTVVMIGIPATILRLNGYRLVRYTAPAEM